MPSRAQVVEQFGERRLIATLKSTTDNENEADVVVSTAHKAKGREWNTVELLDDFLSSRSTKEGEHDKLDPAEVRLFYVAMTRGKEAVDISPTLLAQFDIAPGPRRTGGPDVTPSRAPLSSPNQAAKTSVPAQAQGDESDTSSWWLVVLFLAAAFYFFS